MNKLQAATRDRAANRWKESKVGYRVGSFFKACANCGETEEVELSSGRTVLRYKSGYDVTRAYSPKQVGWTYWCGTCFAKDLACWDGATDIGMDALVGSRDAVKNAKAARRREWARNDRARLGESLSRDDEVARLEAEVARLMAMLKK